MRQHLHLLDQRVNDLAIVRFSEEIDQRLGGDFAETVDCGKRQQVFAGAALRRRLHLLAQRGPVAVFRGKRGARLLVESVDAAK